MEPYSLGNGGTSIFNLCENADPTIISGSGSASEFRDLVDNTIAMLFDGMEGRKSAKLSVSKISISIV